ncbi:MAG: fibronectin type III domain-containing protein [Buchananella hordeovulneris]|nr:fibronectin type III domain-containing protein [Buchananella hordeovulneris]
MSHTWGPSGPNHFRLGIKVEQSPATVSSSTSQVTLTVIVYGQSLEWGHNWSGTLSLSGDWSGSKSVSFYSGFGETTTKELHRWSTTVPTSLANAVSKRFSASIGGYGAASVTHTHTVPRRPYYVPSPPSNVRATYLSQGSGRVRVTWQGNPGSVAPWDRIEIRRFSNVTQKTVVIATLPGAARSYDDVALPSHDALRYFVRPINNAGHAEGSFGWVRMRPNPPQRVTAKKQSGGSVRVEWSMPDHNPAGVASYMIYDSGASVGSVTGGGQHYWVHSNPSATGSHVYTVRARAYSTDGGELLESQPSAPSNVVTVAAPPAAPTDLTPNSGALRPGSVSVSWRHNPVDSSDQALAVVEWSDVAAGGSTYTRRVYGSAQSLVLGSFQAGQRIRWRVRTGGVYQQGSDSGLGPWSAYAEVDVAAVPTVSIQSPGDNLTHTSSRVTVTWGYYQPAGIPQIAAVVTLSRSGSVVETRHVTGAASSVTLETRVEDGARYVAQVQVTSASGLTSIAVSHAFSVAYPRPAAAQVTALWDETLGAVTLAIINPPGGGKPSVVSNRVERSIDDGQTWELVDGEAGPSATLIDPHALSHGTTRYRVAATTDLPSITITEATATADSDRVWLAAGPGFTTIAALAYNPRLSTSVELEARTTYRFAGRPGRIEVAGTGRDRRWSIGGTIDDHDTGALAGVRGRLEEIALLPAPALFRDPLGHRVYGSLSGVACSWRAVGIWEWSGELEEVEYDGPGRS